MRTSGMGCRSHAATAVCVPGDARSMIVSRRPDRKLIDDDARVIDVKYSRLGENKHGRLAPVNCRRTAVTLPMVTKKERSAVPAKPSKPKTKPKQKISTAINSTVVVSRSSTASINATEVASSNDLVFQVVVMKVSIHCQGCAGKVRKHLSKMEGVTSFSIDLESKKVTVMGHVSPAGVLESLSKVKKAELFPALIEN